jgi:hypothetical protein
MTTFSKQIKLATLSTLFAFAAGCGEGDSTAQHDSTEDGTALHNTENSTAQLNFTEDSQSVVADSDVAVYKSLDELDMLKATDNIASNE